MLSRRAFLVLTAALPVATPALAHHGWRWTKTGAFELTGIVREAKLGNPHGILTIDADGEMWTAEVGQPWRNERAGLTDAMMAPGAEITILGKRADDPKKLVVKAERVTIKGVDYDLYPERL